MDEQGHLGRRDFRDAAAHCRSLAAQVCEPRRSHLLTLAQHYDYEADDQQLRAQFVVSPRLTGR